MSENSNSDPRRSRKLDLSTGKKSTGRKKAAKGFAPVVQQTINLSTPKPEKTEAESGSVPKRTGSAKAEKEKGNRRPRSQGNSLADLLDPETLAKLRG